jgi:hypothetical protein
MTTTIRANTVEDAGFEAPDGDLRNLRIGYPPGFVAMPSALPACSNADFIDIEGDENACSDSTAIGIGGVTASGSGPIAAGSGDFLDPAPVYKLTPAAGSVARIGLVAAGQPVVAELGLNDAPPYNGFVEVSDLTQAALFYSARISIWGNPADPVHDSDRGQCVFVDGSCPASIPMRPFLTTPRSCVGPVVTSFEAVSWDDPAQFFAASVLSHDGAEPPSPLGLTGCSKLGFGPLIHTQPSTDLADTPSGLDIGIEFFDEGLVNSQGVAHSEMKKLVLSLPEGMIMNAEVADSLLTCTPSELAQETIDSEPGDGCPFGSEIGAIKMETPLLDGEILEGQVFAAQGDALYAVVKDPQLGILVKQAGEVEYDAFAEQLTVTFDNLPQLPVSHLGLRLNEGDDGLLLTPAECGEFVVAAAMFPWSKPGSALLATSAFEIVSGPAGGPCPSGREAPVDPGADPTSAANPPLVSSPPPPSSNPPSPVSKRPCPKGKRRVRGKGRCVRRRCRRTRASGTTVRHCVRPQGRRRR